MNKSTLPGKATLITMVLLSVTTSCRCIFSKNSPKEILYKLAEDYESDEYKEGSCFVYDIASGSSYTLVKNALMDYEEAFITADGQYIVLSLSGLRLYNKDKILIEEHKFCEEEVAIGGKYSNKHNKLFFLLRVGNAEGYRVDLCRFDLVSKNVSKVIKDIRISYENLEEPFKDVFLIEEEQLVINNYNYQFLAVKLSSNDIEEIVVDNKRDGRPDRFAQHKGGLVYLKRLGWDEQGMHYQLVEYDFKKRSSKVLVTDIISTQWRDSYVYLRTDPIRSPIVLQVDNVVYCYDKNDQLYKLPLEGVIEILAYQRGILLYRGKSWTVQSYRLP